MINVADNLLCIKEHFIHMITFKNKQNDGTRLMRLTSKNTFDFPSKVLLRQPVRSTNEDFWCSHNYCL